MRILSFLLLIFCSGTLYGQKSQSELGFGLGVLNYTGDLTQSLKPRYFRPGVNGHFRLNISNATSFKASLTGGRIVGSDQQAPVDSFAVRRDHEFGIYLVEVAGIFEYHFFKWKENPQVRWTPYVFGGLGLFTVMGSEVKKEYSSIQPVLPFGMGVKYVLNPRHMLEFQFGARKTFFDYLDNVSEGDLSSKNFQYGNWRDNDMYYYMGFSFTISFYDIPCPKVPYN